MGGSDREGGWVGVGGQATAPRQLCAAHAHTARHSPWSPELATTVIPIAANLASSASPCGQGKKEGGKIQAAGALCPACHRGLLPAVPHCPRRPCLQRGPCQPLLTSGPMLGPPKLHDMTSAHIQGVGCRVRADWGVACRELAEVVQGWGPADASAAVGLPARGWLAARLVKVACRRRFR